MSSLCTGARDRTMSPGAKRRCSVGHETGMGGKDFEPELALVTACLRWPRDAAAQDNIGRCMLPVLDWERVLGWARRHRVTSFVFDALRRPEIAGVPAPVLDRLRLRSEDHAAATMRQIG